MRNFLVMVALGLEMLACHGSIGQGEADAGDASSGEAKTDAGGGPSHHDAGADGMFPSAGDTSSNIEHLVVIIQENHSFDSYFGRWCTASTGSNPSCNGGPSCCEAGPATAPGSNATPVMLDDAANGAFDPNHTYDCNSSEIHAGAMDQFVVGTSGCADARNFAYADPAGAIKPYVDYATRYAIADQYFQPVIGASSSNDMYFARAQFVFQDNAVGSTSIGSTCGFEPATKTDYHVKVGMCSPPWYVQDVHA